MCYECFSYGEVHPEGTDFIFNLMDIRSEAKTFILCLTRGPGGASRGGEGKPPRAEARRGATPSAPGAKGDSRTMARAEQAMGKATRCTMHYCLSAMLSMR